MTSFCSYCQKMNSGFLCVYSIKSIASNFFMNKFISLLPLLFISACSQTPVPCEVPAPNHSGYFNQALNLPQGGQLVVEEGALEPRSIGSITVLLYRDLEVGDFVSGLSFAPGWIYYLSRIGVAAATQNYHYQCWQW